MIGPLFDAGFVAGKKAAEAEIDRLSASHAELLFALRCVKSDGRFGHWHADSVNEPNCISCIIDTAIAKAEKMT